MEIFLREPRQRLVLLAVCLATAAILLAEAGRIWLASHRLASGQLDRMERGAALMPGNAAAWDDVGRLRQWDFANPDIPGAIAAFERAVATDPRSAHFWMDLAGAYEAAGDPARARDAFLHAKAVYPASAEVAFYYGNYLLRRQQHAEAYAELQFAVRTDPSLLPLAISRTWRSSEDVNELLDRMLPPQADAYIQALDFFATIHQAEPGLEVWKRLLTLHQPITLARTFPFFDELIHEDRGDDARRIWREAVLAAGEPYRQPPNGSLIWNGDFARELANGGLEWRWVPFPGISIDSENEPAPGGSRAVRLDFNGGSNPDLAAPRQYVPVQPATSYRFHAYMRTQEITTESGMRFALSDPNHADALGQLTDDLTGSHPWTPVDAEFTTGPQTHFLLVQLRRKPSRLFENKLGGTVWIADISLIPSASQPGQASP